MKLMPVALLLLTACVSPSELLVNDRGQVIRCWANGGGWLGAPLAYHAVNTCVADYERLGYKKMSREQ